MFLIFGHKAYYPYGGAGDLIDVSADLDTALKRVLLRGTKAANSGWTNDNYEVLDTDTLKVAEIELNLADQTVTVGTWKNWKEFRE